MGLSVKKELTLSVRSSRAITNKLRWASNILNMSFGNGGFYESQLKSDFQ